MYVVFAVCTSLICTSSTYLGMVSGLADLAARLRAFDASQMPPSTKRKEEKPHEKVPANQHVVKIKP